MHQNLAVILWQITYGKNSFAVLIPDHPNGQGHDHNSYPGHSRLGASSNLGKNAVHLTAKFSQIGFL